MNRERQDFRVIIAGSRTFNDYKWLKVVCNALLAEVLSVNNVIVISGGASGADSLGELYAKENGLVCEQYPADWKQHGNAAGPIRNRQMAAVAQTLIVFWDGKSRGTKNMIEQARKKGLIVHICPTNMQEGM